MALRRILQEGEETLRKISKRVDDITPRICALLDDLHDTLQHAEGAGLAAPQVGVLRRIAVADIGDKVLEMINPEIIHSAGECIENEGCLSIPERYGYVPRPETVRIATLNRRGERVEMELEGWAARVVCHEIDHLDGVLYIDREVPPPEGAQEEEDRGSV